MADEPKDERAYLLITFDLPNQLMLKTEEVTGNLGGKHQPVKVDWVRLFGTIKHKVAPPPKGPPWTRTVVDDDYRPAGTRPWKDDDETGEADERPPEV